MASLADKFNKLLHPEDDFDDDYDDYEDDNEEIEERYEKPESNASPSLFRKNPKIISMNQKPQLQVVVYRPLSFKDDTSEIAKTLLANSAVVINLEKTEKAESRRILDFLSGVAFAQNGKLNNIATATYIITPENVELSGDELFDEFENSGVYF